MIKKEGGGETWVSISFFHFFKLFWRRRASEKYSGREKEELEEGNVKPGGKEGFNVHAGSIGVGTKTKKRLEHSTIYLGVNCSFAGAPNGSRSSWKCYSHPAGGERRRNSLYRLSGRGKKETGER